MQEDSTSKPCAIWLAAVCFSDEHECQDWFGSPTEVWGGISNLNGISYILLTSILSRVAFCITTYTFGRVIGTDSVMIVSPID